MSEAKVIFTFEGADLTIQCTSMDKMSDICQKYATKVDKPIDSLIFLYGGNQVNFGLTFKDQATSLDRANNQMKVLVYPNENERLVCPKCGEKIKLKLEELDNIILSYEEIKDSINGIKSTIENMIKTSSNNQLKNINKLINIINEDIQKNNQKLKNLLNDQNNIIINNTNDITNNINNIKSNEIKNNSAQDIANKNETINDKLNNKNLLENVESKYIIQIIFSFMNEKVKFKSIRYNKKLQNKINISLYNYKFFSGRYIEYEARGKGKEYNA